MPPRPVLRRYLVTDRPMAGPRDLGDIVAAAVRGGVTIVQHMNFGSDVNRAELETRLARHKQETIGAVIDARRRGGPIKKAFG